MIGRQRITWGVPVALLLAVLFFPCAAWSQPGTSELHGVIFGSDSLITLSRVSVMNKRTSGMVVTNPVGKFSLAVADSDTVVITSIGFVPVEMPVKQLRSGHKTADGRVAIYLATSVYELKPVFFTVKRPPKLDRQYYQDIFNRPKASISSPLSALYERFSKRGKELRKLELEYNYYEYYKLEMRRYRDAAYPEYQTDEEVMKLIRHCNFNMDFVKNAIDYDFNLAVRDCMKTFTGQE